MQNTFRKGSIIKAEASTTLGEVTTYLKVFSIVDKIKLDKKTGQKELYCKHSVCSVDHKDLVLTKSIYSNYEGELADAAQLIEPEEFDMLLDSNLLDKKLLVNITES